MGQGTWKMGQSAARRHEEIRALQHGIELGMNLVDTAEMYDNEELVGEAVRDCREKVLLVSKVLPSNASYRGTKLACERSLLKLGTEYIDLYLLHWKGRHDGRYVFQRGERMLCQQLSGCDISDDICHAVNKQQKADYLEGDICNRYQVIGQVAVKSEHGCIHQ